MISVKNVCFYFLIEFIKKINVKKNELWNNV